MRKYNDGSRALQWPKEHWHVAFFGCLCILLLASILVNLGLLSLRAGVAAGLCSVIYVLMVTWQYTHSSKDGLPHEHR